MKTFVLIIGKPGAGKTTVADYLARSQGAVHFSYSELLHTVQPDPLPEGFTLEDRRSANEILLRAYAECDMVIVDANPYSEIGLESFRQVFDVVESVHVIHLQLSDAIALERLEKRNREVASHDGTSQGERIQKFTTKVLPWIETYSQNNKVTEIDVSDVSVEEVAQKIILSL